MKTYTLFIIFIFSIFIFSLVACTQAPPSEPKCRTQAKFTDRHQGLGACLIRIQDGLLVTQSSHSDAIDLARGDLISNETSQCAAHRHMWQKTGLNVEVAQLLGVNREGLRIYACKLGGGFDGSEDRIMPPSWADGSVEEVRFIDPFVTRRDEWQHPKDLILIRDAYVALGHSPVLTDKEIYLDSHRH